MILDIYAITMLFVAGFCFAVAYSSWRRYSTGAGRALAVLQLCLGIWSLFQGIEVLQTDASWKIFYSSLSYIGVATVGPALFVFTRELGGTFTHHKTKNVLYGISGGIIAIAFTNDWHGQLWPKLIMHIDAHGNHYLEYGHGWVFYAIIAFEYACIVYALIKLIQIFRRNADLELQNRIILGASIIIPWGASISYVLGIQPHPGIDVTPIGFAMTSILINHAMETHLLDVGPLARESLVEIMEEGVVVLDSNYHFQDSNQAGRILLQRMGLQPESAHTLPDWGRILEDRSEAKGEWGTGICIAWHILPLWNAGTYSGSLLVLRDKTSEKNFQARLQHALNEAKSASKAKTDFLSAMSHEIRTPLNAIIGLSRELSIQENTEENKSMLQSIVFSGENLLSLVNDLLDWSKMEAGKMELDPIPLQLGQLLQNICSSLELRAKEKDIQLILDNQIPVESSTIKADGIRLIQVLINLLGNAIKFTERGNIILRVRLLEHSPEKVHLLFEVIDQGIGIAPDKIEKIFERFSQAEGDTARRFGGTGLGLSISSNLVEMMGGKIKVQSEINQGSTFFFDLFFETAILKEQHHSHTITNYSGKVLVVDDVKLNLVVAKKSLERKGFSVETLSSGLDALELSDLNYDLIFLDLHMPEVDGFEVIQAWRKFNLDVPIIALTADVSSNTREKIKEVGFDSYLAKPFRDEDLRNVLEEMLNNNDAT